LGRATKGKQVLYIRGKFVATLRTAIQKWQGKIKPKDDQTIVVVRSTAECPCAGAASRCGVDWEINTRRGASGRSNVPP
jgi:hypothetical protein